jgi:hypothetical protein
MKPKSKRTARRGKGHVCSGVLCLHDTDAFEAVVQKVNATVATRTKRRRGARAGAWASMAELPVEVVDKFMRRLEAIIEPRVSAFANKHAARIAASR